MTDIQDGRLAAATEEIDKGLRMIPEHCRYGLRRYLIEGAPVGHFLTAVVENDLLEAATRADTDNIGALRHYAHFLYNFCPRDSYGSKEKVAAWIEQGGLDGAGQ